MKGTWSGPDVPGTFRGSSYCRPTNLLGFEKFDDAIRCGYVYPINDREPSYENEIESAIADVVTMQDKDAIEHDWGITEKPDHSFYFFIPKHEPNYLSGTVITSLAGHFIKVRMTFLDDLKFREFSLSFMNELLSLVHGSNSGSSKPN